MVINYENRLKRVIDQFGNDFSNIIDPEARSILILRKSGLSYSEIQKIMGNPSKKHIRNILLNYSPDLINIDTNHQKLEAKYNDIEKRIRNLLKSNQIVNIELDDEDASIYLKNNELIVNYYGEMLFNKYDELTQNKILNQLINGV